MRRKHRMNVASLEAYVTCCKSSNQRKVIRAILKAGRPLTARQIAGRTRLPITSVRPRITGLVEAGKLRMVDRVTERASICRVWRFQ